MNKLKLWTQSQNRTYSYVGDLLYDRSSPTGVKVLSPTSGFLACGSSNGRRRPQRICFWRSADLIAGPPQDWGKQKFCSWRVHTSLVHTRTQGKKQWPHKRLGQTYLLVLEGLLQRWEAAVAHCGYKDIVSSSSGKDLLVWAFPETAISPTKQTVDSSARPSQAKQPARREHGTTHQQTSG